MARYLFRVTNKNRCSPSDVHQIAAQIRSLFGSKESASHFRIGSLMIEFNVFARNQEELNDRRRQLQGKDFEVLGTKLLDTPSAQIGKAEALMEGIGLFNEERFWESHEVLEQIWRGSSGAERDAVQSLILAAAAFVHYQKDEPDVCLSVLKRARAKAGDQEGIQYVDIDGLRKNIDRILASGNIRLFKLRIGNGKEHDFSTRTVG